MTGHTEELVKKFAKYKDITDIPGIINAMQEEDNVGSVIGFKNCFRQLRNIAAHEPATITSQIATGDNSNNTKLVFQSETGAVIVLDTVQFTAWMFDMYKISHNIAYLVFWKTFMCVLYPKVATEEPSAALDFTGLNSRLVRVYDTWANYMYENYGQLKTVNITDPYVVNLFKENPKVFWRMAIPNMFDFVRCYLNGAVSLRNEENIDTLLALFKVRE